MVIDPYYKVKHEFCRNHFFKEWVIYKDNKPYCKKCKKFLSENEIKLK